jgi:hypothetical protein
LVIIFRVKIGDGCPDLKTVSGDADGLAPNAADDSTEPLRPMSDPLREPGRDVVGEAGGNTRTAPEKTVMTHIR